MERDKLELMESVRNRMERGDASGAMKELLDVVTALMDEVDILNIQLETLVDALNDEDDELEDGCSYIVTCSECECMVEVDSELLEDEEAELSCPICGAILVF